MRSVGCFSSGRGRRPIGNVRFRSPAKNPRFYDLVDSSIPFSVSSRPTTPYYKYGLVFTYATTTTTTSATTATATTTAAMAVLSTLYTRLRKQMTYKNAAVKRSTVKRRPTAQVALLRRVGMSKALTNYLTTSRRFRSPPRSCPGGHPVTSAGYTTAAAAYLPCLALHRKLVASNTGDVTDSATAPEVAPPAYLALDCPDSPYVPRHLDHPIFRMLVVLVAFKELLRLASALTLDP